MTKRSFTISVLIAIVAIVFNACSKDDDPTLANPTNGKTTALFNPDIDYGTLTDQDGNVYKTVTIGTQTWMAENLRTTKYNDGTSIPEVTDAGEWLILTTGAYCNYNNTASNDFIATYGRLYNWYAINTGKLAPEGWHVPTHVEWTTLVYYLGSDNTVGGKLKEAGTTHWSSPNAGATNETGFTALPGGERAIDGKFYYLGDIGSWWNTTEKLINGENNVEDIYITNDITLILQENDTRRDRGMSVRCVKD